LKRKRLYFGDHFLSFVLQQDSFGGIYLSIINRNIALFGEIRKSLLQEVALKKGGRTPLTIVHLDILWGADERGQKN
jgi:hypothetical protein